MDRYLDIKDEILATKDEIRRIADEHLAAVTGGAKAPSSPAEQAAQSVLDYYARMLSHIW
jgi:hypothetical protein